MYHQNGIGIDVFEYEGLPRENIFRDLTSLPFDAEKFDTIVLIAAISHIPRSIRIDELRELHRLLKKGGNLIFTEDEPISQWLIHKWVKVSDRIFGTNYDVDSERGMSEGESYCLSDSEIRKVLKYSGFLIQAKKRFVTQWGLNKLYIARKDQL